MHRARLWTTAALLALTTGSVFAAGSAQSDSTAPPVPFNTPEDTFRKTWGLDIMLSNDGFGLGGFYRKELTKDLAGFISFSASESKDEREVEQMDYYYGRTYVPGKLNRFMVFPLMAGVQYRLFREDITDSFRPYVNAGAGPTMIYMMPYVDRIPLDNTGTAWSVQDVDFFKAVGRGRPTYTFGGFIGFGANFGPEPGGVFGVNFRYYFTYVKNGLPSLFDVNAPGQVTGTKSSFGGFFITLNVGMSY